MAVAQAAAKGRPKGQLKADADCSSWSESVASSFFLRVSLDRSRRVSELPGGVVVVVVTAGCAFHCVCPTGRVPRRRRAKRSQRFVRKQSQQCLPSVVCRCLHVHRRPSRPLVAVASWAKIPSVRSSSSRNICRLFLLAFSFSIPRTTTKLGARRSNSPGRSSVFVLNLTKKNQMKPNRPRSKRPR